MNSIFHSADIYPHLEKQLNNVESELLIVSAFVKINALRKIDSDLIYRNVKKKLLVRFRKEDILHGSTDIDLYQYCVQNGWEMYIDLDLHSKIFVFDKKKFCIGSANITLSGLGLIEKANVETICQGDIGDNEYHSISELFGNAVVMNDHIFSRMSTEINRCIMVTDENLINNSTNWDNEIICHFNQTPRRILVSELIFSKSPFDMNSRDRALLSLSIEESIDFNIVRERFKKLKCYKWLFNAFEDEIYYGRLTSKLHSDIVDNPEFYRSDVKSLLSNLLNWIIELEIGEISIDRPNYSQRIRKNKEKLF